MIISMIVAMDKNRGIGKDNKLLCHLPNDLSRFQFTTTGYPIVIGRKTFESLPQPLKNRQNIVITRDKNYKYEGDHPDVLIIHDYKELFWLGQQNPNEYFICGGEEIYKLFLPYASRLYITEIDHEFEADSFFPEFDESVWELTHSENGVVDKKNKYKHTFKIYDKVTRK